MTINLDDFESKAKAAGGDEWFASVIGLRVSATNAKIGGETPICDIRGWGYLTGQGHGALGLSEKEAIAVQRAIADYIASANPATMLALVARIRELEERDTELSDAAAQVLDDMGKNSLNCCGAAKADLRAALGEWPDLDFTLADAQAIIDLCDYGKVTPNV